jgi:hypothetical protein
MRRRAAKKVAKKKSAAKKTAKKAGRKKAARLGSRRIRARKNIPLSIKNGVVSQPHQKLKKNRPTNSPDKVQWRSLDVRYTLTFDTPPNPDPNPWPFIENPDIPPAAIQVPAHGSSGWFTIRPDAVEGGVGNGYGYTVDPADPGKPTPEVVPEGP